MKKDEKFGLLSDEGKVILNPEYVELKSANKNVWDNDGIALGYEISKIGKNGRVYGFADKNGKIIVNPKYENIEKLEIPGHDYYVFVQENGKKGLYKNARQILNPIYQELSYSKRNIIIKKDGKYGMTDLNGKELIAPRFTSYKSLETHIAFKDTEKEYVYDEKGNQVGKGAYKIISVVPNKNYLIVENYSGERMVVNGSNILKDKFIDITYVFDDKFIIYKDEKYGIASLEKGVIVKPQYEYISLFQGTNILVASLGQGKTKLYNRDILPIEFREEFSTEILNEDILMLHSNNEKKYINNNGIEVKLEEVLDLPAYSFKENGKWGFKNKQGEVLIKPIYEMTGEFNSLGFVSVKKDGKWGSINKELKEVLEPKYEFKNDSLLPKMVGKYLLDDEKSLFAILVE